MVFLQERNPLPRSLANNRWHKASLKKLKAISELKPPTNQKDVREFLGIFSYYRKCINRFSDAARPLSKLTKKNVKSDGPEIFKQFLNTYIIASLKTAAAVLMQQYPDENGSLMEMPIPYLPPKFPYKQFKQSTAV